MQKLHKFGKIHWLIELFGKTGLFIAGAKIAKRKIQELAEIICITQANLSILKTWKAKAIRFSTLEAIYKALDCQPGDILEYRE